MQIFFQLPTNLKKQQLVTFILMTTWFGWSCSLLVSFGPDIVTAGVLTDSTVPTFVAYVSLASSILLKIGTALGFVAASNSAK